MLPLHDLLTPKCKTLERRLEREGFESIAHLPYEKYLRSALWLAIREWVIERDNGICTICEGVAAEVHHHDYDESTMWGEQSDGLTALCARCHKLVEFEDNDSKRYDLTEKRETYNTLKNIHTQLKREGFSCSIKKKTLRTSNSTTIEFEGNKDFLKFINFTNEMFSFCITSRKDKAYREAVKYPMPFDPTRLAQKSGLTIKSRTTNEVLARIKTTSCSITLTVQNGHSIPFEEQILAFLKANCFAHFFQFMRN